MNGRLVSTAILLAIAVAGVTMGATAKAFAVRGHHDERVLHLVVEHRLSGPEHGSQVVEYWLDESRNLARSLEHGSSGQVVNATGSGWWLHVPPHGPAIRYEGSHAAPFTRGIFWRLYYLRDAYRSGIATRQEINDRYVAYTLATRRAVYDRATGLPVWQTIDGRRMDFVYHVNEQLPRSEFPESFFSAHAATRLAVTREADRRELLRSLAFSAIDPGDQLLGRDIEKAFVTRGESALTIEQLTLIYGDIRIEQALLAAEPKSIRPGGAEIRLTQGTGRLHVDPPGVHAMVLIGNRAINVFAPDTTTAMATLRVLGLAP